MIIEMRQRPDGVWAQEESKPDPFTQVASELFGVPPHLVTPEMRKVVKIKFYQSMYNGRR